MPNLEQSLFLPPDRWAVQGGEMYVRFPVEYVTLSRGVRDIWFHFPLDGRTETTVLQFRLVESEWDEGVFIQSSRPFTHPGPIAIAASPPFVKEDAVKLNGAISKWVSLGQNFGLYVQAMHQDFVFPSRPPFLEIIQEPAREGVVLT
jgi:hypothetical protein